jgi:extracellular factor (EF) 3-hydroxypalmitic acid methyl ester biosynthesis protein
LVFKCLDFEKSALDHINSQIKKIEPLKKQPLSIEYISSSIASLIRDKGLKARLGDCDLIYAFGIFDYLSDRMASRLTKELFQLLGKGGKLVIFNISSINDNYRAYYELLGEWSMIHRTKEQMLAWTKEIKDPADIGFASLSNSSGYLCLSLVKR